MTNRCFFVIIECMPQDYNVLAPGPVNLHPEVLKILSLPSIHHRTPEFESIFMRVLQNLKKVFKTEQPCFLLTSTGSGGMEAILTNVMKPHDRVLCLESGKFGERWSDMAERFQGQVTRLKIPWGNSFSKAELENFLSQHPDFDIVLTQHCETSTATSFPIQDYAEIFKSKKTLFLVDAITSLGALELKMDDWGLDGVVGGSQKAFMLPTGLSLICFSKKAWLQIEKNPTPRYYFDVRMELKANQKGESFFSSNVFLVRALDYVLSHFEKNGLHKLCQIIQNRAQFTREAGRLLGLQLFSKSPSDSVTAFWVPENCDSQKFRDLLEKNYRTTIMGGQDQVKGKIIRIGHMGHITEKQMIDLFLNIHDTFQTHFDYNPMDIKKYHEQLVKLAKKYALNDNQ